MWGPGPCPWCVLHARSRGSHGAGCRGTTGPPQQSARCPSPHSSPWDIHCQLQGMMLFIVQTSQRHSTRTHRDSGHHAVLQSFHTVMALAASAGLWHVGQEALLADDSYVLKPGRVLHTPGPGGLTCLPVSNLTCCLNDLFFLSTNPAARGL